MVNPKQVLAAMIVAALVAISGLAGEKPVAPFSVFHVDRSVGSSMHPLAVEPAKVGSFPGHTKSGAGVFYDEVLEYRVWLCPDQGAKPLADNDDYFAAFARYETALEFSKKNKGADEPLVLVRQRESINEPKPGKFVWVKTGRITEWQVRWLKGSLREPKSIPEYLAAHSASRKRPATNN